MNFLELSPPLLLFLASRWSSIAARVLAIVLAPALVLVLVPVLVLLLLPALVLVLVPVLLLVLALALVLLPVPVLVLLSNKLIEGNLEPPKLPLDRVSQSSTCLPRMELDESYPEQNKMAAARELVRSSCHLFFFRVALVELYPGKTSRTLRI